MRRLDPAGLSGIAGILVGTAGAAVVAADAQLIVTFDLDDVPPGCEPLGVEETHPDDFLVDLYDLNPKAVRAALEPPTSTHLSHSTNSARSPRRRPRFADAIRAQR